MKDFGGLSGLVSLCGVCGERGFGRREANFGSRAALQLGFDFPGQRRLPVLMQDHVVTSGIDVFGIDEESVHVKETGADSRESGAPC